MWTRNTFNERYAKEKIVYLGLNIDQDPSACLFKDGKIFWYNEEKKITGDKTYDGMPYRCIDQVKQQTNSIQQCVVTGYNYNPSDVGNVDNLLRYKGIKTIDKSFSLYTPHHLSHL